MKKIIIIAAFAVAVSLPASFGTGRIEVRTLPVYDQNRDQQWMQSQRNQQIEQQRREDWQRGQWQMEQQRRNQQHQNRQGYEFWVQHHQHDYDNRGR